MEKVLEAYKALKRYLAWISVTGSEKGVSAAKLFR
jgi:hypothetical protein